MTNYSLLINKQVFNICNPATPEAAGYQNIVSKKDLLGIKDDSNAIYLLNVHLNWDGNKLINNYGFDIANLIRVEKKSKSPVIFYSPIQQSFFEKKSEKEFKYKILFGRGFGFIETPIIELDLVTLTESIIPLSNATLHDVATMLCDLKGIVIDKLNHDLKFDVNTDSIIASIDPYLSNVQKQLIGLERFVTEIKSTIKLNDYNRFLNEKLKFITLCNYELTDAGKDKPIDKTTKHRILVIDDMPEEIEKVKRYLKLDFSIIEATSGKEAVNILEKDVKNEIVAVISDWRLFTDTKQNYWQSMQGYEVLDFAANNGIRSLFALTSQADFIVHHLRNLMGIRFSLFKKENLRTEDQWKVFSNVLFEACEQTVKLRCAIPKSENWCKSENTGRKVKYVSLHQQYIEKWNSDDRDNFFSKVDQMCNEIWSYLELEKTNKYKGVYSLKSKYNLALSPTKPELFPVLVFRRIWMALWYSKNISNKLSSDNISDSLKFCHEVMFSFIGMSEKYKSNSPGVEMNKLCLLTNEILAMKMLPEERDWLLKQDLIDSE